MYIPILFAYIYFVHVQNILLQYKVFVTSTKPFICVYFIYNYFFRVLNHFRVYAHLVCS